MVLPNCHSTKLLLCLLAVGIAFSGCQMLESLSPSQMWKLNRQSNMDRGDAYFSVPAERDSEDAEGDVVTKLEAPDLK